MRPDWLGVQASVVDAVRAIEGSNKRMTVVVDDAGHLLGTLTDGDIRRFLLRGGRLEDPARLAMNNEPVTVDAHASEEAIIEMMLRHHIRTLPVLDEAGFLRDLIHYDDLGVNRGSSGEAAGFEAAVIMAGGEGRRLRPITDTIPKPMVEVGGMPLIERQILSLVRAGISKVFIAVNYLSNIIEEHFGDGRAYGIVIGYLRENEPLGTAGALSLLEYKPSAPIVVMNGDIITDSDFANLYNFHRDHASDVTVAAVDYHVNIPYGVIKSHEEHVTDIIEKPGQRFLCNAGIYAVDAGILELIPGGQFYNMTELLKSAVAKDLRVCVFPIHEYWSDIGTAEELEKARSLFNGGFFDGEGP